ncbi:acyltransferase [Escherichia coli]
MNDIFDLMILPSVVVSSLIAVKIFDLISPIHLPRHERNLQIDGLRGLLALFVFVHHASIWKGFLKTGVWENPPSNFFTNIGQVGVSIFFMITGYLFFTKIRNGNQEWIRLYTSRFFRLTPMFLFSFALILFVAGEATGWKINTSYKDLFISIARWAPFTLGGMPNINGLDKSFSINAAVTWTLVYEWFFYLSLPLIAFMMRKKVGASFAIISFIFVCLFVIYPSTKIHIISFACGFIASLLKESKHAVEFSKKKFSSLLVLSLITFELFFFKETYNIFALAICGISFALICCGCSLFGALDASIFRKMGEATYSIYLLHGIFLYAIFRLPPAGHEINYSFITICLAAFAITFISCATYKLIELPFINYAARKK